MLFVISLVAQLASLVPALLLVNGASPRSNPTAPATNARGSRKPSSRSARRGVLALLLPPAVWLWCIWSLGMAPAHSYVATNWQVLLRQKLTASTTVKSSAMAAELGASGAATTTMTAGAYTRPHLCSTRAVLVTESSKAPQHMGQKGLTLS